MDGGSMDSRPKGLTHASRRRLISICRRLIFWLRVESGILKRSAASVWLQPLRSSISRIMRRSQASIISNSDRPSRFSGKAASGCGVVLGKLLRQEFRPEGGSGGKHDGALDGVFEFAHVAGPVVVHQHLHRFRGEVEPL